MQSSITNQSITIVINLPELVSDQHFFILILIKQIFIITIILFIITIIISTQANLMWHQTMEVSDRLGWITRANVVHVRHGVLVTVILSIIFVIIIFIILFFIIIIIISSSFIT